jgi:ABC-type transport system substrate-binding protein
VNQTTWEFKLSQGIRFHNGEPFDAEAVKFSLERLIDPRLKLRGVSAFTPLTHVEIVDPFTVRVPLTSTHVGFEPARPPIAQDLTRAKQLLTEAGFPNGLEMVLNSPQGRYVRDREVAEAVAGQLTRAGIPTTVRVHEWAAI